jgi:hypothetical protein
MRQFTIRVHINGAIAIVATLLFVRDDIGLLGMHRIQSTSNATIGRLLGSNKKSPDWWTT